jgi:hypothetical protein
MYNVQIEFILRGGRALDLQTKKRGHFVRVFFIYKNQNNKIQELYRTAP